MISLSSDLRTNLESPRTGVSLLSAAVVGADIVASQLYRDQFPPVVMSRDLPHPPHQFPGLLPSSPRPVTAHGHIEAPAGPGGEDDAVPASTAAHQPGVALPH